MRIERDLLEARKSRTGDLERTRISREISEQFDIIPAQIWISIPATGSRTAIPRLWVLLKTLAENRLYDELQAAMQDFTGSCHEWPEDKSLCSTYGRGMSTTPHLPFALSISLPELQARLAELPKGNR